MLNTSLAATVCCVLHFPFCSTLLLARVSPALSVGPPVSRSSFPRGADSDCTEVYGYPSRVEVRALRTRSLSLSSTRVHRPDPGLPGPSGVGAVGERSGLVSLLSSRKVYGTPSSEGLVASSSTRLPRPRTSSGVSVLPVNLHLPVSRFVRRPSFEDLFRVRGVGGRVGSGVRGSRDGDTCRRLPGTPFRWSGPQWRRRVLPPTGMDRDSGHSSVRF